jgi:hypothetical protein
MGCGFTGFEVTKGHKIERIKKGPQLALEPFDGPDIAGYVPEP